MDKNSTNTDLKWQKAVDFFEEYFLLEADQLDTNNQFLAHDESVQQFIRTLFSNKKTERTILNQPVIENYKTVMEQDLAGDCIGSYQLIELIAHGGMSSVYRARRLDMQAQKDVAIKIIPTNLQTEETTALFKNEMRTLSQLHHPNIISMHHGDVADSGTPYLVMELIENAKQIDHFFNAKFGKSISTNENVQKIIEYFITLSHVINYAHQNKVIHQDIKPSNVLLDQHGHLMVLDFGVSALSNTLPDHHAYTLSYAPTEQAEKKQAPKPSFDTFAIVSLLVKCLSQAKDDFIGWQHQAIKNLPIDEDLSFILNKGISSNNHRYQHMGELLLDLQLWLKKMPLSDLKHKPLYRLKKTILRHPFSSALLCFIMVSMTLGLIFYQQQYTLALSESHKAQQVKNILINAIDQNDPDISKGTALTVRDMLSQVQLSMTENQIYDPNTSKDILMTLGQAFNKLGDYDAAEKNINQVLSIQTDDKEALFELATLKLKQKNNAQVKSILSRLEKQAANASISDQISFHLLVAKLHVNNSDFEQADIQFQTAQTLSKQTNNPEITINYLSSLADGKFEEDDIGSSLEAIRQAVELSELHYGKAHSKTLEMKSTLAESLLSSSSKDVLASVALYDELIPQQQALLGKNHPAVAKSLFLKSTAHRSMNQSKQAKNYAEQALKIAQQQFGVDHIFTGKILMSLGAVYLTEGDFKKAIEYASTAVKTYENHFGSDHHETLQYKTSYVSMLGKDNQNEKALELLLQIHPIQLSKLGASHRATLFVDVILSRTYVALKDYKNGIKVGERCLENARLNSTQNMMEVYCAFVLENAYFKNNNYPAAYKLITTYENDQLVENQPDIKKQFIAHKRIIEGL